VTKKQFFLLFCGIVVACFFSVRIYYALTDDFRFSNIVYQMPYEKNWEIRAPSEGELASIDHILGQSFHYLGKGSQSYAFVSDDNQYVLKFFKFKHLRPSWFVDLLPPVGFLKNYKDKQRARKTRKLFGVFNSHKLAYDVDREESGLIFIQLNTVENLPRKVTVLDKLGISHTINLEHVPFVLQKKGEVLRDVLGKLLSEGQIEEAKTRIGQIFALYIREYDKGIFDHDHGVMRNLGFVGDEPLHLDVGKLMADSRMLDSEERSKDLGLVVNSLKKWILEHYPQYSSEISLVPDVNINHREHENHERGKQA